MQIDHSKNIIEIDNVSFGYGGNEKVIENVSFNIHLGDYVGLIGPNGGGKSTILKIILGLLRPQKGEVRLFGKKLNEFNDWSKIGYVPQKATNFDAKFPVTVAEVVAMGRPKLFRPFGIESKEDKTIIKKALDDVEMWAYRDRLLGDLSGGQQQRVFIARALAGEPEVIFLDEPTTGVDAKTQEKFYLFLRKLNRENDLTLILVSHDINVVASEATEVIFLNKHLTYFDDPKKFASDKNLKKLFGENLKFFHPGGHNHA
ncbi:metal ABC transporter ATP-binding protein [Candidatus Saccharibacteria bacterium]|nr:metal ABC transporter ATP-binding protein [Candidatus Saccharibacteria bacterium]